ncbi:MAG: hypothetical protein CL912_12250 [Deltaproteobacteria bacterium]|nr:hypothetical protein [Deltaproteobacteria bacterium]|tara:strand:- start:217 stop:435 length:219 start_codon:yes stop_codon:yes gene_type:complete
MIESSVTVRNCLFAPSLTDSQPKDEGHSFIGAAYAWANIDTVSNTIRVREFDFSSMVVSPYLLKFSQGLVDE